MCKYTIRTGTVISVLSISLFAIGCAPRRPAEVVPKYKKPLQEVTGILSRVLKIKNHIRLVFTVQLEIDIPKDAITEDQLQNLLDRNIGIINIDGDYKIRAATESDRYNSNRHKCQETGNVSGS